MPMKSTLFPAMILLLLVASSCNSEPQQVNAVKKRYQMEKIQVFSNPLEADTFKIELLGSQPKEMLLHFSIIASGGNRIYDEEIKASDLIDNYKESVDLARDKKRKTFMEQEFKLFFEEENFLEPAVTEAEEPDKNTPDLIFFEELKKSSLNGFKYRLGSETSVYIAWSAVDNKVKTYYKCCI